MTSSTAPQAAPGGSALSRATDSARGRWLGPAVTLATVVVLEALALLGYRVPNPPAFILLAVVLAAYSGGLRIGLASAVLGWIYFAWSFSLPGNPFRYSEPDFARVLIWAFATPTMAILVGTLRRDADRAHAEAVRAAAAAAAAQAHIAPLDALRASEHRYRTLAATMVEGILILRDGRFAYANPGALELLGYAFEELEGREFAPFIHPEFRDLVRERHRRRSAGEILPPRYDIRVLTRSGDPRWVQIANEKVEWEGQPAVLTVITDIAERKDAEERLRNFNVELERKVRERTAELDTVNKELEAFTYSVSHDLRAPLRAIEGFSRMLEEQHAGGLDEAARGYLQRVRAAARRMGQLIEDLIAFSRIGRAALHKHAVDLSALAALVAKELEAGAPERRVEWRLAGGLAAHADPGLARLVLENLLGNAWKYTGKTPHALIEFGRTAAGEFMVRDNGAGFDPAHAEGLFQPFRRLHAQEEFEGTGIGLATVKRIVERHGGQVRGEGAVGAGAAFYFMLPGGEVPAAPRALQ